MNVAVLVDGSVGALAVAVGEWHRLHGLLEDAVELLLEAGGRRFGSRHRSQDLGKLEGRDNEVVVKEAVLKQKKVDVNVCALELVAVQARGTHKLEHVIKVHGVVHGERELDVAQMPRAVRALEPTRDAHVLVFQGPERRVVEAAVNWVAQQRIKHG